jgi:hypothetical protein
VLGADTSVHDEIDGDLREQCAALRIDPKMLVSDEAREGGPPPFYLWEEHVDAFEVFHACRRSWRVITAGFGAVYQGLDLVAVDVVMRRLGIARSRQREVFQQLQVMEDEGAKILNA